VESDPDDDLIASITPDVMGCLQRSKFFEKLDDILSPSDGSQPLDSCLGNYKLSESVLRASGFDSLDLTDIFDVLKSQGGFCDCEILYNAAESSRLKANYWRSRARGVGTQVKHTPPSSAVS
jgi:hypothetical protein